MTLLATELCPCRSDIPYAALWGEDPIPKRSHVLLATWLQPDTRCRPLAEQLSTLLVGLLLQFFSKTFCHAEQCEQPGSNHATACTIVLSRPWRSPPWLALGEPTGLLSHACGPQQPPLETDLDVRVSEAHARSKSAQHAEQTRQGLDSWSLAGGALQLDANIHIWVCC